jgi:hypothetical protein
VAPTPEARAKLLQGLASKWDGVVVTSARALSKWGDADSISAIRDALIAKAKLPHRWMTTGAMTAALAPHMSAADLSWSIPLVLKGSNRHFRSSYSSCWRLLRRGKRFASSGSLMVQQA